MNELAAKADAAAEHSPVVDPLARSNLYTVALAIEVVHIQIHTADGDNPDMENLVGEAPDSVDQQDRLGQQSHSLLQDDTDSCIHSAAVDYVLERVEDEPGYGEDQVEVKHKSHRTLVLVIQQAPQVAAGWVGAKGLSGDDVENIHIHSYL